MKKRKKRLSSTRFSSKLQQDFRKKSARIIRSEREKGKLKMAAMGIQWTLHFATSNAILASKENFLSFLNSYELNSRLSTLIELRVIIANCRVSLEPFA